MESAVLRKLLSKKRALELLFPSPTPPRKKTSTASVTRKRLLIESPSPVRCPRNRFPGPSPSVNPCTGPHAKDSHPKPASDCVLTPSRARISSPLATAREQRPHRAPNRNVTYVIRDAPKRPPRVIPKQAGASFPHQAQCGRVPAQWTRVIRSLAPVRGLIRSSIPLPFHFRTRFCLLP